jgi:hypothetical protein
MKSNSDDQEKEEALSEDQVLDVEQARITAFLWHERQWSPLLYCYAILGSIGTEEFARALRKEANRAVCAVKQNPEAFARDDPERLRNMVGCLAAAVREMRCRGEGTKVAIGPGQAANEKNEKEDEEWQTI